MAVARLNVYAAVSWLRQTILWPFLSPPVSSRYSQALNKSLLLPSYWSPESTPCSSGETVRC